MKRLICIFFFFLKKKWRIFGQYDIEYYYFVVFEVPSNIPFIIFVREFALPIIIIKLQRP